MDKILAWLQGKKTYLVVLAAAIYNGGIAAQWWTAESQTWTAINMIFAALGIGAFRSAVNKITPKPE